MHSWFLLGAIPRWVLGPAAHPSRGRTRLRSLFAVLVGTLQRALSVTARYSKKMRTEQAEDSEHVRPLLQDLSMNFAPRSAPHAIPSIDQHIPRPASAITSKSSPRSLIRLRNCALARSSAATASNSFFFSRSLATAAALVTELGSCDWRDGATDARMIKALARQLSSGSGRGRQLNLTRRHGPQRRV